MPLGGERKTLYQREYMRDWQRRKRAPRRIERLTKQLSELQQLVGCDPQVVAPPRRDIVAPKHWLYTGEPSVASPWSPRCEIDFPPAPPREGFSNFQKWKGK